MPDEEQLEEEQQQQQPPIVEKPKKRVKQVGVRVISGAGQSVLVEWRDDSGPHRAYVPREDVSSDTCSEDVLSAGMPYGVEWAEIVDVSGVTPQEVARQLRRHNLWTHRDIQQNPAALLAAINNATRSLVKSILSASKMKEEDDA